MEPSQPVIWGLEEEDPWSPPRTHRYKTKHKAYVKHCLNFELTQCWGVCNATAVGTCQQALQSICDTLTRPAGSAITARWLGESEEEALVAGSATQRELVDSTCANSQSLGSSLDSGDRVALVGASIGERGSRVSMVACEPHAYAWPDQRVLTPSPPSLVQEPHHRVGPR